MAYLTVRTSLLFNLQTLSLPFFRSRNNRIIILFIILFTRGFFLFFFLLLNNDRGITNKIRNDIIINVNLDFNVFSLYNRLLLLSTWFIWNLEFIKVHYEGKRGSCNADRSEIYKFNQIFLEIIANFFETTHYVVISVCTI